METIVLYPSPGMGHLIALVELGKFILKHHPSFAVVILISPPSFNTGTTAAYISHISATVPSITFHQMPSIDLDLHSFPSMESIIFEVLRQCNPHVRRALELISLTSSIRAFIIDFFCTTCLPIANELKIPTFYFYTSGAYSLAFFFYFPELDRQTTKSFKDLHTVLHIPGVPPMPSSDMIKPILDRATRDYADFLDFSFHLPDSAGIIVNTFEALEPRPLKAIRDGLCNPGGNTPPIFCIGPLIADEDRRSGVKDASPGGEPECWKWLDKQPRNSVVFLCFGSLGLFSAEQLKEIAVGLERSGQRFLWVVRSPPSADEEARFLPPPEPDLHALLPSGFLERTKDRGFVVKSWAPQVAVLNHGAVGGFVTHCGWNSVLEAVMAGVPMVAWPLYAEQRFNRVVLVEDMKLALPMEEAEDGLVAADEVEKKVRKLMESAEGELIRKAVEKMKEEAKAAMSEEGSSIQALANLVKLWKEGN